MTPQQRNVLDFIRDYQEAHRGVSPSRTEIAAGIGLSPKSKGTVHAMLDELERQGHLELERRHKRDIRLITTAKPLRGWSDGEIIAEAMRRGLIGAGQLRVACCGECGEPEHSRKVTECDRAICGMRSAVREAA